MIHIIVTGRNTAAYIERHMSGLNSQRGVWRCTWIDDASDDGTWELAQELHDPKRIKLVRNEERRGALRGLSEAIYKTQESEIVIPWDADDFFPHDGVIERIAREYDDPDCWMTYGSTASWPTDKGIQNAPYVDPTRARYDLWRAEAPRSFRAWLFHRIDPADLLDDDGKPWQLGWDLAVYMPMLEMAGLRAHFIPEILYLYNIANPTSDMNARGGALYEANQRVRLRPRRAIISGSQKRFSTDWFSRHIAQWEKDLAPLMGKPNLRALEIGSFEGRSACWMLEHLLDDSGELTCVDTFRFENQVCEAETHGLRERFEANVADTGRTVKKFVGRSQHVLPTMQRDFFDFVYVDGSHAASDVLEDAVAAWRVLKPGGILTFDDYELEDPQGMLGGNLPKLGIDSFLSVFKPTILHMGYQVTVQKPGG